MIFGKEEDFLGLVLSDSGLKKEDVLKRWKDKAEAGLEKSHDIKAYEQSKEVYELIHAVDPEFKDFDKKMALCDEKIQETIDYQKKKEADKKEKERLKREEKKRQKEKERQAQIDSENRLKRMKRKALIKKLSIVLVSCLVLATIIIVPVLKRQRQQRIEARMYNISKVTAVVTNKENKSKETFAGSTRYNSSISVTITNNLDFEIDDLFAEIKIYSIDNPVVFYEGEVTFYNVSANANSYFTVEIKSGTDKLWNCPELAMVVEMRFVKATFSNNTLKTRNYPSTEFQIVHSGNVQFKEITYQQAVSLFNQGGFEEAKQLFETIRGYLDSLVYITKCEEAIYNAEVLQALKYMAGDNAVLPENYERIDSYSTSGYATIEYESNVYDAFFASICIKESDKDTFVSTFTNQLLNAGFEYVGEGNNMYKKGATVIVFSGVEEVYGNFFVNYYATQVV